MIRNVARDTTDTPQKVREVISSQCGQEFVPGDIGYYNVNTKHWIHNRLDINDVWDKVESGSKVTLWCTCLESPSSSITVGKRPRRDAESDPDPGTKRKKVGTADSKKELVESYETQLTEKHSDKYTRFQYKLWAEMLASGVHNDTENPPAASMFSRNTKTKPVSESSNIVSSMVSVVNTLCDAVTSKPPATVRSTNDSPMKRAELRTTYIKQLSDLRDLFDKGILCPEEYEEQRQDVISLMRCLK